MPHDGASYDPARLLPDWWGREARLARMLPHVSLVNDTTVRTRGNELFQCLRLEGLNSFTTEDDVLDKTARLFASIMAQSGTGFTWYVHKVSKAIRHGLTPATDDDFAAAVDAGWRGHLDGSELRDRTLTLTVMRRPSGMTRVPLAQRRSIARLKEDTEAGLRQLGEVVGFLRSTFADQAPRMLTASSGELLGFLGSLNTGQELPIMQGSRYGYLAQDVANTRVTFRGPIFEISEGPAGRRFGTTFAVKTYPAKTSCIALDELALPADMVITHSYVPVNSNLMAERIKRQQRLMKSSEDGALSLLAELTDALDDLEAKRLSFGDHHMTVTVFAETLDRLETLAGEIRNIASTSGIVLINEGFAARCHYFAQHPGMTSARARTAAITNRNFADLAALHRCRLGKQEHDLPWGEPITMIPTPERSAYRFSFHERGKPDREPSSGHTLILGRPGSGKSVLAAFLIAQARRLDARIIAFDYRQGLEMAVRALGGRYASIKAGQQTGLNPLRTETDERGQAWLSDWLAILLARPERPLTPIQTNWIREVARQNAEAASPTLQNWSELASLMVSAPDQGDLHQRLLEWSEGRYGWIFGLSREDTFRLEGEVMGFDLTGILDAESDRERMAVLSYLFRRVERLIEDRRRTIIVVDEAWKALDNEYFAERLNNWLVTARKQNAVVVMLTQYASQLVRTRTGKTIIEAVPTQILLPNTRAKPGDYDMLALNEKELAVLMEAGTGSRMALVRDDVGSVVIDADLSSLGPLVTVLGGMDAGEKLVGPDYRDRPDFWRVS